MERLFRNIKNKTSNLKVVDIGANVGNFTTEVLQRYPDTKSHMFEANPKCETESKRVGQPYTIVGLSSQVGTSKLYVENSNPYATGASFYKENTKWYEEVNFYYTDVVTQRLDAYSVFAGSSIDLVKIDTQGSEFSIIQGGVDTLSRSRFLLVELSLTEYNQGAPQFEEVFNLIESYNFRVKDLIETHRFGNTISQIDVLFSNENFN